MEDRAYRDGRLIMDSKQDLVNEIDRLRAALNAARRGHVSCDDCWYSCPKSEDGCCNDQEGDKCNCGADAHNAAIDAALRLVPEQLGRAGNE